MIHNKPVVQPKPVETPKAPEPKTLVDKGTADSLVKQTSPGSIHTKEVITLPSGVVQTT